MMNTFLQQVFAITNGGIWQVICFSGLTIGTSISAFVSVKITQIFHENPSASGMFSSWMITLAAIIFTASSYPPITFIALTFFTIFAIAVFGIRRVLSASIGGYTHAGMVTGVLGI